MSNVFLSGTIANYKLMDQVAKKLEHHFHTINWSTKNPEDLISHLIHTDLAIFVLVKRGWYPFFNWGDRRDVLVELGMAVGQGTQTVVVGNAERVRIFDHPWVRRMGLGELLHIIDTTRDLSYIPPTQVNLQEEKERRDREAKL